ncbi:MAG: AtzE family amidohydrolase [Pseudomonadota bacterium]
MSSVWPSIQDLASSVRRGERSAVDVTALALARIDQHNAHIGAFTCVLSTQAMDQVRKIDGLVAAGQDPGPLAGVPFAVKDLFDVKGLTTTAGAKRRVDAPPAADNAALVQRLIDAGAVLVGKLNMDEFAYGFSTVNAHFGTTRNPHDLERLAGGSSGGSAAAVAAELVPFALGSDTNGSVRVPASLCGVIGLRPTHGSLPLDGVFPFVDELDTVGAFTRSSDDAQLIHEAMAGQALDAAVTGGLRAGVLQGFFCEGIDPSVLAAVDRVAAALRATPVELSESARARSAAFLLTSAQGGRRHLDSLREDPLSFDDGTRDRLLAGALLPEGTESAALAAAQPFADQLAALFETVDVLVTATTPVRAPRIDDETITINGQAVNARAHLGMMTQPVGLSGVPALSLPIRIPEGDLPIGVQIVADRGREALLFAVAKELESDGIVAAPSAAGFADLSPMRESA